MDTERASGMKWENGIKRTKLNDPLSHFFFNWDALCARLNSHYEAWSYKEKNTKKDYRL